MGDPVGIGLPKDLRRRDFLDGNAVGGWFYPTGAASTSVPAPPTLALLLVPALFPLPCKERAGLELTARSAPVRRLVGAWCVNARRIR